MTFYRKFIKIKEGSYLENLNPYMDLIGEINAKNNFISNRVDYFIAEDDIIYDNYAKSENVFIQNL